MYETHLLYARLSRNPETGIIPLDQADNACSRVENWFMIAEQTNISASTVHEQASAQTVELVRAEAKRKVI
jgi:hypothetical protein